MFFKKIKISNYGSIADFDYNFSKTEQGFPKPLVIIGKNGSGKSLILANLVDSIIELKRELYPGGIQEVNSTNYFKVGKKTYIKNGHNESFVGIDYSVSGKDGSYVDVASYNPKLSLESETFRNLGNKIDNSKFLESGFCKSINGKPNLKDFESLLITYFPVDRYSVPNWFNDNNYTKVEYDSEKFVGKSSQNILKMDVCANVYEWIYRVYSHKTLLLTNNQQLLVNDAIQSALNKILTIITGVNSAICFTNRKSNDIPILMENNRIPDIRNLSSGEVMIFSIFASLIKEYDEKHDNVILDNICGVCLIDEIDLNLHINQQMNVLPKLIKMFPKVQFIITTHSPFFVKGMFDEFNDSVDFVEMPSGKKINYLADFSEIKEAIKVFENSKEIIDKLESIENEYENLLKEANDVLVITEGKTDCKYIQKAFSVLGKDSSEYRFLGIGDECVGVSGDKDLDKILESQKSLGSCCKKIIAIFDNDEDNIMRKYPSGKLTEVVKGRVYAFCLPVPTKRKNENKISIEHFFTNDELRTIDINGRRLYQVEEFYDTGVFIEDNSKICKYLSLNYRKHNGNYVLSGSDQKKVLSLDGKTNYSLSKNDFCDNVINDVPGYDKFDFNDFNLIIDLIESAKSNII